MFINALLWWTISIVIFFGMWRLFEYTNKPNSKIHQFFHLLLIMPFTASFLFTWFTFGATFWEFARIVFK